jgi:hypothetical protein
MWVSSYAGNGDSILPKQIAKADYEKQREELRNEFIVNKIIPSEIELQCLIALSRYPELKNTHIEFKYKKIKTIMAARPKLNFIVRSRYQRTYRIIINDSEKLSKVIDQTTFNSQIGLIAHELAHILHYEKINRFGLVRDGLLYPVHSFRKKYEKQTDIEAISRGFGWQIYDYVDILMTSPDVPLKYKAYKQKFYFSLIELKAQMAKFGYGI